jgi:hypothetical protein
MTLMFIQATAMITFGVFFFYLLGGGIVFESTRKATATAEFRLFSHLTTTIGLFSSRGSSRLVFG